MHPDDLLRIVDSYRTEAYRKLDPAHRAERGQFLTPPAIARFMASMLAERRPVLRILDAGAGVGTLSGACIAEIGRWEQKPQAISITAYEMEPLLANYLRQSLDACVSVCARLRIRCTYDILQEDFISASVTGLSEDALRSDSHGRWYNCAILNPPYREIKQESDTRRQLHRVEIETTNLYAAFVWLAFQQLEPEGELVAITPRSFCNGPYFRRFRLALLEAISLRRIHVYESREKAFAEDRVLQENLILYGVKSSRKPEKITVSTSDGPDDGPIDERPVEYQQVIPPDQPDVFIYIVSDDAACQVGEKMRRLGASLDQLGLTVSTGRVVDFRASDRLRAQPEPGLIPLIYPGHFSAGFIAWPDKRVKRANALTPKPGVDLLTVPAGCYVLVKRFSTKEEKRRVVAAVYDPGRAPGTQVGFENHLNYYHRGGRGLPLDLAKGLAAFLNSTLVDQYLRQFNGHTQVNAADLRALKYPEEARLQALGRVIGSVFPNQPQLDRLVQEHVFQE